MKPLIKYVQKSALYDENVQVTELNSFISYKLQSFPYIWNPLGEKIIEKKHLKVFLERAFIHNFLTHFSFTLGGHEQDTFTFLSREIYTLGFAQYNYPHPKESHPMTFYLDASNIYEEFSHLISAEDFSKILEEILAAVDVWGFYNSCWSGNFKSGRPFEVLFLAKKQEFQNLSQEGELWVPEDFTVWKNMLQILKEDFASSLNQNVKHENFSILPFLKEACLVEKIDQLTS